MSVELVQHNKVRLALHTLRAGSGRPLLLLHGLGERTPERVPPELASWDGRVAGLDFTGHGESTVPRGGGYTAEILMHDADMALARVGEATVLGRGLGAYVALMIAGARPKLVRGCILCDGPGLDGGGARGSAPRIGYVDPTAAGTPDPYVFEELTTDARPPDYATTFVWQATEGSGLPTPIAVAARARPEWLAAIVTQPGVAETSLRSALSMYSAV